jgi:hypothetical protein
MQSESGVASFVDAPIFVGVYRYCRVELARKQALFWRDVQGFGGVHLIGPIALATQTS